ncbi:DUF4304 domain-containing protein [Phenylobacterium terrae]|uniref:DUF4304 domain-containing protein n=1 Tax=Phenylobacterium terrae TaxID=2665495 RepID=A0ABW4N5N8_9CAUL
MSRISYAKALDKVLRPLGFERNRDDWIRVRGDIWECVNRQSSWLGGVNVNLFVKDLETEKLYREIAGSEHAVIPQGGTRISDLIGGADRWWKTDDPDGPAELAELVLRVGVPWFDKVRTLEEQAEQWFFRSVALTTSGYHWPTLVGLALTLHRMGEAEEACRVVRKPVPRTANQSSVEKVAKVRAWLGCDAPISLPGS